MRKDINEICDNFLEQLQSNGYIAAINSKNCTINVPINHMIYEKVLEECISSISNAKNKHEDMVFHLMEELSNRDAFSLITEDQLVNVHRFTKRKYRLIFERQFVEIEEFRQVIGLTETEVDMVKFEKMRVNKQVLYVKLGNKEIYPLFQLDKDFCVFNVLKSNLNRLFKSLKSNWDILFWLTEERTVLMQRANINGNFPTTNIDDFRRCKFDFSALT